MWLMSTAEAIAFVALVLGMAITASAEAQAKAVRRKHCSKKTT